MQANVAAVAIFYTVSTLELKEFFEELYNNKSTQTMTPDTTHFYDDSTLTMLMKKHIMTKT